MVSSIFSISRKRFTDSNTAFKNPTKIKTAVIHIKKEPAYSRNELSSDIRNAPDEMDIIPRIAKNNRFRRLNRFVSLGLRRRSP